MAGRSNIIWWLQQRNYEVTDELVAHLFDVAKSQRRLMDDSEVVAAIELSTIDESSILLQHRWPSSVQQAEFARSHPKSIVQ